MFQDGTEDNVSVKAWIDATPTSVIQAVFEDMKEQVDNTPKGQLEEADGRQEPSTSTA